MKWLLDKLALLASVVVLIGGFVALKMYWPFSSHDDEILERAGQLAIELCECTGPSCAERIQADINKEIVGQKVDVGDRQIGGGTHTKARDQLIYANTCFDLITRGRTFTINKSDGMVLGVNESVLNDLNFKPGLLAP